jgi:hypothetical protein
MESARDPNGLQKETLDRLKNAKSQLCCFAVTVVLVLR